MMDEIDQVGEVDDFDFQFSDWINDDDDDELLQADHALRHQSTEEVVTSQTSMVANQEDTCCLEAAVCRDEPQDSKLANQVVRQTEQKTTAASPNPDTMTQTLSDDKATLPKISSSTTKVGKLSGKSLKDGKSPKSATVIATSTVGTSQKINAKSDSSVLVGSDRKSTTANSRSPAGQSKPLGSKSSPTSGERKASVNQSQPKSTRATSVGTRSTTAKTNQTNSSSSKTQAARAGKAVKTSSPGVQSKVVTATKSKPTSKVGTPVNHITVSSPQSCSGKSKTVPVTENTAPVSVESNDSSQGVETNSSSSEKEVLVPKKSTPSVSQPSTIQAIPQKKTTSVGQILSSSSNNNNKDKAQSVTEPLSNKPTPTKTAASGSYEITSISSTSNSKPQGKNVITSASLNQTAKPGTSTGSTRSPTKGPSVQKEDMDNVDTITNSSELKREDSPSIAELMATSDDEEDQKKTGYYPEIVTEDKDDEDVEYKPDLDTEDISDTELELDIKVNTSNNTMRKRSPSPTNFGTFNKKPKLEAKISEEMKPTTDESKTGDSFLQPDLEIKEEIGSLTYQHTNRATNCTKPPISEAERLPQTAQDKSNGNSLSDSAKFATEAQILAQTSVTNTVSQSTKSLVSGAPNVSPFSNSAKALVSESEIQSQPHKPLEGKILRNTVIQSVKPTVTGSQQLPKTTEGKTVTKRIVHRFHRGAQTVNTQPQCSSKLLQCFIHIPGLDQPLKPDTTEASTQAESWSEDKQELMYTNTLPTVLRQDIFDAVSVFTTTQLGSRLIKDKECTYTYGISVGQVNQADVDKSLFKENIISKSAFYTMQFDGQDGMVDLFFKEEDNFLAAMTQIRKMKLGPRYLPVTFFKELKDEEKDQESPHTFVRATVIFDQNFSSTTFLTTVKAQKWNKPKVEETFSVHNMPGGIPLEFLRHLIPDAITIEHDGHDDTAKFTKQGSCVLLGINRKTGDHIPDLFSQIYVNGHCLVITRGRTIEADAPNLKDIMEKQKAYNQSHAPLREIKATARDINNQTNQGLADKPGEKRDEEEEMILMQVDDVPEAEKVLVGRSKAWTGPSTAMSLRGTQTLQQEDLSDISDGSDIGDVEEDKSAQIKKKTKTSAVGRSPKRSATVGLTSASISLALSDGRLRGSRGGSTKGPASVSTDQTSVEPNSTGPRRADESHGSGDGDRRCRGILVTGLPVRSSDSSLKDGLFYEYKRHGKVTNVCVMGEGDNRHAVVTFRKPEDAKQALEASVGKMVFGARIKVTAHEGFGVWDDNIDDEDISNMDEYHEKSTRTIFVGNLEKDVKIEDVIDKFKQLGEILDVEIKRHGTQSAYAFVQFSRLCDAVSALKAMEGAHIGGNKIKLGFGKARRTCCVLLENIPGDTTDRDFRESMSRHGDVTFAYVDHISGRALAGFTNIEDAQTCVNSIKARPQFHNRKLQIDFASRESFENFLDMMEKSGQLAASDRPKMWTVGQQKVQQDTDKVQDYGHDPRQEDANSSVDMFGRNKEMREVYKDVIRTSEQQGRPKLKQEDLRNLITGAGAMTQTRNSYERGEKIDLCTPRLSEYDRAESLDSVSEVDFDLDFAETGNRLRQLVSPEKEATHSKGRSRVKSGKKRIRSPSPLLDNLSRFQQLVEEKLRTIQDKIDENTVRHCDTIIKESRDRGRELRLSAEKSEKERTRGRRVAERSRSPGRRVAERSRSPVTHRQRDRSPHKRRVVRGRSISPVSSRRERNKQRQNPSHDLDRKERDFQRQTSPSPSRGSSSGRKISLVRRSSGSPLRFRNSKDSSRSRHSGHRVEGDVNNGSCKVKGQGDTRQMDSGAEVSSGKGKPGSESVKSKQIQTVSRGNREEPRKQQPQQGPSGNLVSVSTTQKDSEELTSLEMEMLQHFVKHILETGDAETETKRGTLKELRTERSEQSPSIPPPIPPPIIPPILETKGPTERISHMESVAKQLAGDLQRQQSTQHRQESFNLQQHHQQQQSFHLDHQQQQHQQAVSAQQTKLSDGVWTVPPPASQFSQFPSIVNYPPPPLPAQNMAVPNLHVQNMINPNVAPPPLPVHNMTVPTVAPTHVIHEKPPLANARPAAAQPVHPLPFFLNMAANIGRIMSGHSQDGNQTTTQQPPPSSHANNSSSEMKLNPRGNFF